MLCLRCSRGLSAVPSLSITSRVAQKAVLKSSSTRTFTSLAPLRPTLSSSFRPSLATSTPQPSLTATTTGEGVLDLLPKPSAHPALAGIQVRCGPRNTFNPSHFVRKRRHGFLSRIRTRKGRMTLQRRRAKRRTTLSH